MGEGVDLRNEKMFGAAKSKSVGSHSCHGGWWALRSGSSNPRPCGLSHIMFVGLGVHSDMAPPVPRWASASSACATYPACSTWRALRSLLPDWHRCRPGGVACASVAASPLCWHGWHTRAVVPGLPCISWHPDRGCCAVWLRGVRQRRSDSSPSSPTEFISPHPAWLGHAPQHDACAGL